MASQPLHRHHFSVAWICTLPVELAAAQEMLDVQRTGSPVDLDDQSRSLYTFGRIGEHDVVLVNLPAGKMGNDSAAIVAGRMHNDFPALRFCLIVGIGGGVPSSTTDIRLGDVVVSQPQRDHGGVIQYDFGKAKLDKFERTGSLNAPPIILLDAMVKLRALELRSQLNFTSHLLNPTARLRNFARASAGPDHLFDAEYLHVGGPTCDDCDQAYILPRPWRDGSVVKVHYGTIASGNQVIRDAITRDKMSSKLGGVLCFEMQAAALMDLFPGLVIRGICDYADSHKNKDWQPYAAATAAAYAKELLLSVAAPSSNPSAQVQHAVESPAILASIPIPDIEPEFTKAINDFKSDSKLPQAELREFQSTDLGNLEAAMALIQQKQSQTKRLRYMKRLEPFLQGAKELGNVLQVLIGNSDILAFIWGPMKSILQSAATFDDAFDSILDVYEAIGEQIPVLSRYQSLFTEKPYIRTVLVMIFEDILTFQLQVLKYFEQKVWRQLFHATWKNFPLTKQRLCDKFSSHRQLIINSASLAELEEIRGRRRFEEATFENKRRAEFEERRRAVLQWLSSAESEAAHQRHLSARANTPNSGQWLLNDQRFQAWFNPKYCSTPLLWLNGKLGAGKSVLASRIIDEVKSLDNVSLAFFYCNESDPSRNTFLSVARGLLAQLLPYDENLLLHMDKKRQESTDAILSRHGLAKEFLRVALKRRKSYVILDGIDECQRDQRKEICGFFQEVVNSLPRKNMDEIRCLFVSQDDGIARKDLSTLSTLAIRKEDNHCDIEEFSKHWQSKIETRFGKFPKEVLDIANLVTERAQGIFIFAKCVLEELFHQTSRQALLKDWNAEKFPIDLDEAYQRVMNRILETGSESSREVTKKLLGWISCAKRPLRWHEIQGAMSLDLEDGTINSDDLRLVQDSKELCASLVEVHPDQTIALVHPTVKDFLFRKKIINPSAIHHQLCSLSIRYLCFDAIALTGDEPGMEKCLMSGQYAFYEYTVATWVPHLLSWLPEAEPDEVPQLAEDIDALLEGHYSDPPESDKFEVSKPMEEKLKILRPLQRYQSLTQTIIWSRKLQAVEVNNDGRADSHQILDFPAITKNIRSVLERILQSGDDDAREEVEHYYGTDLFKCSKVYCRHFYRGFSNRGDRDKHIARHDRPHRCSAEFCLMATIGFVSKRELEKHMVQYHSSQPEFPNLPTVSKEEVNKRKTHNPARYQCDLCSKMFTGRHNLNSHLRSHAGERPFACKFCQRAFVRNSDKKRHEKICKKAKYVNHSISMFKEVLGGMQQHQKHQLAGITGMDVDMMGGPGPELLSGQNIGSLGDNGPSPALNQAPELEPARLTTADSNFNSESIITPAFMTPTHAHDNHRIIPQLDADPREKIAIIFPVEPKRERKTEERSLMQEVEVPDIGVVPTVAKSSNSATVPGFHVDLTSETVAESSFARGSLEVPVTFSEALTQQRRRLRGKREGDEQSGPSSVRQETDQEKVGAGPSQGYESHMTDNSILVDDFVPQAVSGEKEKPGIDGGSHPTQVKETEADRNMGALEEQLSRQKSVPYWRKLLINIKSRPLKGYYRLFYICGCGDTVYLDVRELSDGGIERLKRRILLSVAAVKNTAGPGSNGVTTPGQAYLGPRGNATHPNINRHGSNLGAARPAQTSPARQSGSSTGGNSQSPGTASNRATNQSPPQGCAQQLRYLLLCVNTRSLAVLVQPEVSSLTNDQYLFHRISEAYHATRHSHELDIMSLFIPTFAREWLSNLFQKMGRLQVPFWQQLVKGCSIVAQKVRTITLHKATTADFVRFRYMPIRTECRPHWFKIRQIPPTCELTAHRYHYHPDDIEIANIPFAHLIKPGPHHNTFWADALPKKLDLQLKLQLGENTATYTNINVSAIKADLDANKVTTSITQAFNQGGHVTLSSSAAVTTITKGISRKIADPPSKKSFYLYITDAGGADALIEVYNENIDQHLNEFEFVFASVDVVTNLASADVWAWLQPTSNGYAVSEPEGATNDTSIFAMLSVVQNHFDVPKDQKEVNNVSVVMDDTYYTVEKAIGWVSVGLCVIGLGALKAASVAEDAAINTITDAEMMEANASEEAIRDAFENILESPGTRQGFLGKAGESGLEMLQGLETKIENANLWGFVAKLFGALSAITGLDAAGMVIEESTLEAANQHKWEKTPAFTPFADMAICRYSFGGLTNLQVQTAGLTGSMQIGFATPPKSE
ncbi:hypothetical protein QBC44DRAFT_376363 [Cladorrhinum sp. PSN332]|nr:hypothetical protein QBC44DRAFT_376363 [Cladorrhinum sp. PSN332]